MKPFDVRLLRYARGVLPLLSWGALLGVVRALAIVAWAWSIGHLIAWYAKSIMVFDWSVTAYGQVFDGLDDQRQTWIILAVAALITRAASTWCMNWIAERGAATVKDQLRTQALAHIGSLGPGWGTTQSEAGLTLKLSRGLDALDSYFSQYLPQLFLTITVTPLLVLVLFNVDFLSAIIVVIVFPIIPVFMILIGLATQGAQDKQWKALGNLSNAYLDVVRGLPTLKLFRREERQLGRVQDITDEYRSRTMKVLRVTFLSGFVLDLAGTFSVALVAVTVGTRLVDGAFPLTLALFVLLLVPEVFVPIRQVGAAFHASSEGLAAAEEIFEILEAEHEQPAATGTPETCVLSLTEVQAVRDGKAVASPITFTLEPGQITVLAGPSGVGKTTLLNAMVATQPCIGEILAATAAWSGQRPGLLRGTVASNVALGADSIDDALVRESLERAALGWLDPQTPLGTSGSGLSGGQSQRVALARAFYRLRAEQLSLLILDEPTSALDGDTEAAVLESLSRFAAEDGIGIMMVSHRPAVIARADQVIRMKAEVEA